MLDFVLEVMRAERSSIMVLEDKNLELTIKATWGLKKEIINKACARLGSGIAGRIGGDEYGIILFGKEKKSSINMINRIVDTVSNIPTEIRFKLSYPITLSCGVVVFPDDVNTSEELVEKAKTALVSARIIGGNRIKFFGNLEE